MSDSNKPSLMQLCAKVLSKLDGVGRHISVFELLEWVEGYRRAFASEKFPLGKIDITAYQILEVFAETPSEQLVSVMDDA